MRQNLRQAVSRVAADKGCVAIKQFGPVDMDQFYGVWRDGVRAKGKKLERRNGLFNFV